MLPRATLVFWQKKTTHKKIDLFIGKNTNWNWRKLLFWHFYRIFVSSPKLTSSSGFFFTMAPNSLKKTCALPSWWNSHSGLSLPSAWNTQIAYFSKASTGLWCTGRCYIQKRRLPLLNMVRVCRTDSQLRASTSNTILSCFWVLKFLNSRLAALSPSA